MIFKHNIYNYVLKIVLKWFFPIHKRLLGFKGALALVQYRSEGFSNLPTLFNSFHIPISVTLPTSIGNFIPQTPPPPASCRPDSLFHLSTRGIFGHLADSPNIANMQIVLVEECSRDVFNKFVFYCHDYCDWLGCTNIHSCHTVSILVNRTYSRFSKKNIDVDSNTLNHTLRDQNYVKDASTISKVTSIATTRENQNSMAKRNSSQWWSPIAQFPRNDEISDTIVYCNSMQCVVGCTEMCWEFNHFPYFTCYLCIVLFLVTDDSFCMHRQYGPDLVFPYHA